MKEKPKQVVSKPRNGVTRNSVANFFFSEARFLQLLSEINIVLS